MPLLLLICHTSPLPPACAALHYWLLTHTQVVRKNWSARQAKMGDFFASKKVVAGPGEQQQHQQQQAAAQQQPQAAAAAATGQQGVPIDV